MTGRSAGILLSISSLPSKYGIGCFDESAYRFVDFLKAAGQSYWQILPLGPTSYGDSPYQSFSTYAGNPYYISLDEFVEQGLLTIKECADANMGSDPECVDYSRLYTMRYRLLKTAYSKGKEKFVEGVEKFSRDNKWLADYSLFMALKDKFGGIPFTEWDDDIRLRKPEALKACTEELADEIGFYSFLQYHFYKQWEALKAYANESGIMIIGDIPIYVAADSADVWAASELFQLDKDNIPTAVAGCPPDGFSADGQLWGNPLYDWEMHRKTGYKWWISRISHSFRLFDVVRIDHFRGFDEYYSVPYGEKTAINGHWEKGPGMQLFKAIETAIGKKNVIAEDLGFMTDSVRQLVRDSGFPNMKVLEFAFDSRDTSSRGEHLPHSYSKNCVAYTGTHDNQTITSWFESITEAERQLARDYLCDYYTPSWRLHTSFISLLMRSNADLCIIPMQDWLGLDDRSRMNTPSTVGKNWRWRMRMRDMSDDLCEEILKITEISGRKA